MRTEHIDHDNSFTMREGNSQLSFSLRGNASVFHHFYEYTVNKGYTPKHQMSVNWGDVSADEFFKAFKVEITKKFTEQRVQTRCVNHYNIYDKDFDFSKSGNASYRGNLINILESGISIFLGVQSQSRVNLELMVSTDEELKMMEEFFSKITEEAFVPFENSHTNKFYMITHDGHGLDLLEYDITQSKINNFDINLLYNDDFVEVDEKIKRELNATNGMNGIVLLHGIYGSGKTTYIRHLISNLNKRVIYMPPDMASQLASPAFFNFIRGYPNSILVIEDAETILKRRIEGGSAAISNLLNLSDGIMGDALKIKVICTFNADIDEIDEALLRPGRLIANYYFDVLDKNKTANFVKNLYGDDVEPLKPTMTVAEIYNMTEKHYNNEKPKRKGGIGFTANLNS